MTLKAFASAMLQFDLKLVTNISYFHSFQQTAQTKWRCTVIAIARQRQEASVCWTHFYSREESRS